jgi:methylthioribulose-1-phosphate dehydratase
MAAALLRTALPARPSRLSYDVRVSNRTTTAADVGFEARTQELIAAGKAMFTLGLMPATSGNLSCRLDDGRIAITVSGSHKGRLSPADFVLVGAGGAACVGPPPSAETALHAQIYRRCDGAGAVLHAHAPSAVVLSRGVQGAFAFTGYEVLKAFPGVTTHATTLVVPVFANDQDVDRLAQTVDAWMAAHAPVHGYVLAQHGFYTWGATVADALRHVEAFDHLFRCEFAWRTGRLL